MRPSLSLVGIVFILAVTWSSSSAINVRHVSDSDEKEQLRLKASTDENIAKMYGKYYGYPIPKGNHPEKLNDGKFETSEFYNLRDGGCYDASYLRFDAVMKIQKLYFVYMFNTTNSYMFQSFNIYVSLETWIGGDRENLAKNILVAKKVAFEGQYDIIEVDFGTDGVLARSIGFSNVDKFDPRKTFTKELLVSEVMAFGSLHKRILSDNPLDTPIAERSPTTPEVKQLMKNQLFNMIVPPFWKNLSNPTMAYSMKYYTRTLVPMGDFQACAFDCYGRCNTVVGLVPGAQPEVRYAVTTHHELMLSWNASAKNEFMKSLYDWLCPGCTPEKPSVIPTQKKENTILILDQNTNYPNFFTGKKQQVMDLMMSGQVVVILTYESRQISVLQRDPVLEEIFAWLGVYYSVTINQPWKGNCYLKESVAPLIVSTKHIPFFFFGVGIYYNDPDKLVLPGVYEETSDSKKLTNVDDNWLDYINYMRRPRTGNCYQYITEEQNKWLLYWINFYGTESASVNKRSSYPGIGNYPGMPKPDSRRDAVVIKFAANTFERIASSQLGAASGIPWTYRMLEGTIGGWTICQISRSDTARLPSKRILRPNDFCFEMDRPLKDIRWPFTRGFGAMPEGGDFEERLADYPMIYKPRKMVASFSGVYRLASFLYKHPKWKEIWEKTKMRTDMTVFEMTGDRYSQYMRLECAMPQTAENLYLAMSIFDRWVKANTNYQLGIDYSPWNGRGQYVNYDLQISGGFMHSGYPIQAFFGSEQVNGDYIQTEGSWGICHEIGHNMIVAGAKLDGFGEVSNNILCWLDYYVVKLRNKKAYEPGARFFDMESMVKQWLTRKLWVDSHAQHTFYGYMGWKFGIAVNGNAWTLLKTTTTYNTFGREDRLCWATSMVLGVDMAPYFRLVGLTISPAMITITAGISTECWMPEGDEWAEREVVVAEIAKFLDSIGRTTPCTVKSANIKPLEPVVPFDRYFNITDPTLDSLIVENPSSTYNLEQAK